MSVSILKFLIIRVSRYGTNNSGRSNP